jgi:hypothetical protein
METRKERTLKSDPMDRVLFHRMVSTNETAPLTTTQ